MEKGYLSSYFKAVAAKTLKPVEVDTAKSNQHELNGVQALKNMFGSERRTFPATFIYLSDGDDSPIIESGWVTWYDARANHATRTEYRLYFPSTDVSDSAVAGDELLIGLKPDETVLIIVAEGSSTVASQLNWLFGITDANSRDYSIREDLNNEQDRLSIASRWILEQIGIAAEQEDDTHLSEMIARFGDAFPVTKVFSEYARSTLPLISALDDPDAALVSWMEREEALFRSFEKHLVSEQVSAEFIKEAKTELDIEAISKYFLAVQNRRKSRAGHALENHLKFILETYQLRFDCSKVTENNSKPDFIFPGIIDYHSELFNAEYLTMLGAKTTLKDRWRQVLSEAQRIPEKHLLTLQPAITEQQTSEMKSHNLQLVVPNAIQSTFTSEQQKWLLSVAEFIGLVLSRQQHIDDGKL